MGFSLGPRSAAELVGVHPALVECVHRALRTTRVDFAVHDGLRTVEEQREYMKRGTTRTMQSKHMRQPDGFGHAVDLVPYINGKLRWEWGPLYDIASSMYYAARDMGLPLRWGGAWDRAFPEDYGDGQSGTMKMMVAKYCARHPGPDFIDGPHFELRG